MDKQKRTKLNYLNLFFNSLWTLGILLTLTIGLLLIFNSYDIFNRFILQSFKRIPYIGGFVLSYIKSLHFIDFDYFARQVFKPVITLDVLYFVLSFISFQIVLLLMKRYILKHDHALITSIIAVLLTVSLFLRSSELLHISKVFSDESVSSISTILKFFYFIELLSILAILYTLHQDGKLDYRRLLDHEQTKYYTHRGLKLSLVLFMVLTVILTGVKAIVNNYKEVYHINYRIEFIPQENNKLSIKVPEEISKPLELAGITLPDEIDENSILNQLGLEALDVGALVNNTLDNTLDNATYSIIQRPFNISLTGLLISLLLMIEIFITKKINLQSLIVQSFETVLLAYLFFGPSTSLTTILTLALGFTFFSSFMNLMIMIRDGHYIQRAAAKIQKFKRYSLKS